MLVSEVDLKRIAELLASVPSDIEISSIDLSNGYQLNLIAGEKQINDFNYKEALNALNSILATYKNKEVIDDKKLIT